MNRPQTTTSLTEAQIDELVTEQADNDDAWEPSPTVEREATTVTLPPDLASRAAFFAQLHDAANAEEWLVRIIEERLVYEQAIFARVKRAVSIRKSASEAA